MNIVKHLYLLLAIMFVTIIVAQNPFLESLPYASPDFQQYPIRHHTDHNYPTQTTNGVNARFDGRIFTNNIVAFNCPAGISCYDAYTSLYMILFCCVFYFHIFYIFCVLIFSYLFLHRLYIVVCYYSCLVVCLVLSDILCVLYVMIFPCLFLHVL